MKFFFLAIFNFISAGLLLYNVANGHTDSFTVILLYINVVLGMINLNFHSIYGRKD